MPYRSVLYIYSFIPLIPVYDTPDSSIGITCFINRQLIYNFPEQIFTEAGVISIEHADFDGTHLDISFFTCI